MILSLLRILPEFVPLVLFHDLKQFYIEGLFIIKASLFLLSVAPIKALCSQCFESWNKKFSPLGLTCKELTGDTEIDDLLEIQDSHIILTTPVGYTALGN